VELPVDMQTEEMNRCLIRQKGALLGGHKYPLLDAFAKLREAIISFFLFVCTPACLSIRPRKTTRSHWVDFHEIRYASIFLKIFRESSGLVLYSELNGYFTSIGIVKVKCTLVQVLRVCTGRTAHRGSRGIALLFHDQLH
jgi:hypothetical protein